jgi:nucleotide-binding universal stress UspA family protein
VRFISSQPWVVGCETLPREKASDMYRDILVATGGSPWSEAAVAAAIAVAARTGARLRILTVLPDPAAPAPPNVRRGGDADGSTEPQGQELLAVEAARAQRAGVATETICIRGNVAVTILQTAAARPCDLVILGTRLVTGKRLRLGDITNLVAAKVPQPVLLVKQPPPRHAAAPFGPRLLVPTGGSPWSDDAVDSAITLALAAGFSICLLHVVPGAPRARDDAAVMEGRHLLARGETRAADAGVPTTTVLAFGEVARQIVEASTQQHCDSIIMGARGATGWKRVMLGSICNTVAVATPLPVLLVKHF